LNDRLDQLLAAARWPEPSAESEQRLRAFWKAVSPAQRKTILLRLPLRSWAAAAATLLVAAGVVWFVVARQQRQIQPEIVGPVNPAPVERQPRKQPTPESPPVVVVRDPTSRERLLMAGAEVRYQARVRQAPLVDRVDGAVSRLSIDPAADPAALVEELSRSVSQDVVSQRLIALARSGTGSRGLAAARLLAELRLPRTLPLFLELARDESTKAAAYVAIERLADDATLARLAQEETAEQHRRQLLAALITRSRPQATVAYLRHVANPRTSDSALDALADVKSPPVDALFAYLGHSETAVRFAAARALGRINGPVVARRLATLVERDTHRREALAALVFSRGKEAAEYLRAARRYPELAGDIASVQVQAGL
jgi:HEAT repeats